MASGDSSSFAFLGGGEWSVGTGKSFEEFLSIGAYALVLSVTCSVAAMLVEAALSSHTKKHSEMLGAAKKKGQAAKKHSTTTRKVVLYHELSQVSSHAKQHTASRNVLAT